LTVLGRTTMLVVSGGYGNEHVRRRTDIGRRWGIRRWQRSDGVKSACRLSVLVTGDGTIREPAVGRTIWCENPFPHQVLTCSSVELTSAACWPWFGFTLCTSRTNTHGCWCCCRNFRNGGLPPAFPLTKGEKRGSEEDRRPGRQPWVC
jgi:hypothetical protein